MKKIVVIGVIALFVGVGIHPVFANIMENHPPYAPSNYYPCGETEIPLVINLSWDGGDPDPGDTVTYYVHFDNYIPPPLIATVGPYPWNQTRIEYGPVELEYYNTYYMKIDAFDNHGAYAFGEICCFSMGDNHPPSDPIIDGPLMGEKNHVYNFTFVSTDPDNHSIQYHVLWDDNTEDLTELYPNGTVVTLSHSWDTVGYKQITTMAIDEHGEESHWSTLVIIIKRNKPLNFNFNYLKWQLNHILQVLQPLSISTNDNNEVKHETTVRIHRARGITPYTVKLTEKESDEVDRIFDNLKVSLDSAETDEEIDEIYDDAVVSLYKLGLFPKDMTVEEAQQLVKGENRNPSVKISSENLMGVEENFDCQIVGSTTETFMFDLANKFWNKLLEFLRMDVWTWRRINYPYFNGKIGYISFGRYFYSEYYESVFYPSKGWVWTNGSNGVVKWNGEFRGHLKSREVYYNGHFGEAIRVYMGVADFEGLWLNRFNPFKPAYFVGNAAHVKIGNT